MPGPEPSLDEPVAQEAPPENSRRLENHFRFSKKNNRSATILAMLIWLGIGAAFALWAYIEIRLDYFGQVYEGQVTAKWESITNSRRGRSHHWGYRVSYSYNADGWRLEGTDKVDRLTYELTPGPSPAR